MFAIQRPQNLQLLPGLIRARRPRQAVDRERSGARLGLHVNAAWRSVTLDRELADGVDPETSDPLALRAKNLTSRRGRNRVADGLAGAVRSVTEPRSGFTAALRPHGSEVLNARPVVAALELRLRGSSPVRAQGVAMLETLLVDLASPLYRAGRPGELARRLRTAAASLEHSHEMTGP
jgi:hypothetical protein